MYEELPGWIVMGPRGDAVAGIFEAARSLTDAEVAAIAALPADSETDCYQAVWRRYALQQRPGSSPVGHGLVAVHDAIEAAARRSDTSAFGWDDEDGGEVLIDPAWQHAGHAAAAAALAYGAAAELLEPGERDRLAHRWVTVVGSPRADEH